MHDRMKNIAIFDTALASSNVGDEIIFEAVKRNMGDVLDGHFSLRLSTHVNNFSFKQILYGCTAEAVQVIKGQLRSDQGWLQNKAANDLLNYGKAQIFGDEERTVHVQIDGLPDIGSPDEE